MKRAAVELAAVMALALVLLYIVFQDLFLSQMYSIAAAALYALARRLR